MVLCLLVLLFAPEGEGSKFFQNTGKLPSHYIASHPRRQYSSYIILLQNIL
jgi:hypothetical protein